MIQKRNADFLYWKLRVSLEFSQKGQGEVRGNWNLGKPL